GAPALRRRQRVPRLGPRHTRSIGTHIGGGRPTLGPHARRDLPGPGPAPYIPTGTHHTLRPRTRTLTRRHRLTSTTHTGTGPGPGTRRLTRPHCRTSPGHATRTR
ncbi:hypothetical protein ABZ575_39660, partial [Streptomyces sp. NPDC018347]